MLTARQEEFLETLVKSGRYQNASEVLRDGLRRRAAIEGEANVDLRANLTANEAALRIDKQIIHTE